MKLLEGSISMKRYLISSLILVIAASVLGGCIAKWLNKGEPKPVLAKESMIVCNTENEKDVSEYTSKCAKELFGRDDVDEEFIAKSCHAAAQNIFCQQGDGFFYVLPDGSRVPSKPCSMAYSSEEKLLCQ